MQTQTEYRPCQTLGQTLPPNAPDPAVAAMVERDVPILAKMEIRFQQSIGKPFAESVSLAGELEVRLRLAAYRAADTFDPARGCSFRTYVSRMMRYAVWTFRKEKRGEYRKTRCLVSLDSAATAAGRFGIDSTDAAETVLARAVVPLRSRNPGEAVENADLWVVLAVFAEYHPREALVLRLYAAGLTKKAIAERLGIPQKRFYARTWPRTITLARRFFT